MLNAGQLFSVLLEIAATGAICFFAPPSNAGLPPRHKLPLLAHLLSYAEILQWWVCFQVVPAWHRLKDGPRHLESTSQNSAARTSLKSAGRFFRTVARNLLTEDSLGLKPRSVKVGCFDGTPLFCLERPRKKCLVQESFLNTATA